MPCFLPFAEFLIIGITTTIDTFLHSPPYLFDTIEASSMRFAGVIGALCGMFRSHALYLRNCSQS